MTKRIKHLVFSPDGNRRYASKNEISFEESYDIAARSVANVVGWSFEDDLVDELSIWILSEYNLMRKPDQVRAVTKAVIDCIEYTCKSDSTKDMGLSIRIVGETERFVDAYRGSKKRLESLLKDISTNKGNRVNFLVSYNESRELERALDRCKKEGLELTFENISNRWSIPPVNLFLRTGYPYGFNRLSSIFPGIDQARLVSTDTYPQEFTREEFKRIINLYLTLADSYDALKE